MAIIFDMRLVAPLTVTALGVSALALAQTVRVKWERDTDFSKYETYTWRDEPADDINDQIDEIIVGHIDGVMSVNGIFRDDLEPDLLVTYYGSAEESFGIEGGYRADWSAAGAVTIETHREGTLVVDIVDVAQNKVVWRGIASGTIQREARKNRSLVTNALTKMFDSFPPASRPRER